MSKILSITTEFSVNVNVKELKKFLSIPDEVSHFVVRPYSPFQEKTIVHIDTNELEITYKIVKK